MAFGRLGALGRGFGSLGALGGAGESPEAPTGFVLTDIASGRLFQRTKALTTGPVSAAGTYSGGTPNAIEMQVLLVADDSVVKDWTTASGSIAGGNWSGTITGVPQGGSYYVKARPANATSLAATGSNPFYVGILIVMYGQSNMTFMSSTTSSPPAATAGTTYFNGSSWIAVPAGNGVREMLNALIAATSIPCAALNGAISGQTITQLSKGAANSNYSDLAAQITATGGDFEFIAWHQGEGDSAGGTSQATYLNLLSALHSDLVTDFGRTKSQAPLVLAGLSTNTAGSGFGTDASWDTMQRTLLEAGATLSNVTYSHSNMDAVLADSTHFNAASYGRAGKRYARSMSTLLGVTSGYPKWSIASAATVDATHTDVTLTHGLGTDFTPTSAITGFEVSGDNGANWVTPSAAARTDATTINLTHSSLATSSLRKLRYQFGFSCDVSAPVVDNSSLAPPLLMSAGNISPTPLATLPVPTYRTNAAVTTGINTASISQAALNIVNAAADLQLYMSYSGGGAVNVTAATITPNGGGAISGSVVKSDNTNIGCAFVQFTIPNGTDLTNATVAITLSAAIFNQPRVVFWTCPTADLNSTTAVDAQTATGASAQTATATLATSSGGFVLAVSAMVQPTANTNTWTGTETYAERMDTVTGGRAHTAADASGVAASASTTAIATWTGGAAALRVTAVSYR